QRTAALRGLTVGIPIAAAAVMPFAITEAITGHNPFFGLASDSAAATRWAHHDNRPTGGIRVEAAFGHPIVLAMFLATAALVGTALAMGAESRRQRFWLLAGSGVSVVGIALTQSRTGWLVLAAGLLLLGIQQLALEGRP